MKTSIPFNQYRRFVAYLDDLYPGVDLRQAKVNARRELQCASGEELSCHARPVCLTAML